MQLLNRKTPHSHEIQTQWKCKLVWCQLEVNLPYHLKNKCLKKDLGISENLIIMTLIVLKTLCLTM